MEGTPKGGEEQGTVGTWTIYLRKLPKCGPKRYYIPFQTTTLMDHLRSLGSDSKYGFVGPTKYDSATDAVAVANVGYNPLHPAQPTVQGRMMIVTAVLPDPPPVGMRWSSVAELHRLLGNNLIINAPVPKREPKGPRCLRHAL
jgi:hypothetical protein